MIVDSNSIVEHVIHTKKNGIMKRVNERGKIIVFVKKIILGNPAHVFLKTVSI